MYVRAGGCSSCAATLHKRLLLPLAGRRCQVGWLGTCSRHGASAVVTCFDRGGGVQSLVGLAENTAWQQQTQSSNSSNRTAAAALGLTIHLHAAGWTCQRVSSIA